MFRFVTNPWRISPSPLPPKKKKEKKRKEKEKKPLVRIGSVVRDFLWCFFVCKRFTFAHADFLLYDVTVLQIAILVHYNSEWWVSVVFVCHYIFCAKTWVSPILERNKKKEIDVYLFTLTLKPPSTVTKWNDKIFDSFVAFIINSKSNRLLRKSTRGHFMIVTRKKK